MLFWDFTHRRRQADLIQQSGIWSLSATNTFTNNRAVNHYNGFFLQSTAFRNGRNSAAGKVRPVYSAFGTVSGNVCHSNARFGFYPDSNFPRNLRYSPGGELDLASVEPFDADGNDNGQAPLAVVEGTCQNRCILCLSPIVLCSFGFTRLAHTNTSTVCGRGEANRLDVAPT